MERAACSSIDPFDCGFDSDLVGVPVGGAAGEAAIVDEGRAEGREAGILEGFQEGRTLGQTTGVGHGMEVGFATGLLEAVREALASGDLSPSTAFSEGSLDRIAASAESLEKAIGGFPSSSRDEIEGRLFRSGTRDAGDGDDDGDPGGGDSQEDVRAKLQRIRARCKVLAAKLGIPHHSLNKLMAEAAAAGRSLEAEDSVASPLPREREAPASVEGGNREW
mmetsp:Transcript_17598/g.40176  ORF Transcript_17598/g.40176 Transcript_17598/m.40176 type:complete len:221 (-) Transcript_17598:1882-2544(-)